MATTSTLHTFSKMYSYTEGTVFKVRRELLRLGCRHDEIDVMQQMTCLRLVHDNQELLANPLEVLATLKSIRQPVQVIDIWAILILSHQKKLRKSNQRIKQALIAALLSFALLVLYLVISV
jgi:hypothetical protein